MPHDMLTIMIQASSKCNHLYTYCSCFGTFSHIRVFPQEGVSN